MKHYLNLLYALGWTVKPFLKIGYFITWIRYKVFEFENNCRYCFGPETKIF